MSTAISRKWHAPFARASANCGAISSFLRRYPFIVAGVRLAIGRGLVGMIVAEFYTSVTGLGYMIVRYANALETDKLFVPIVVVMILGVGLMGLAKWVEGRIAPWRNTIR